jgi:hypothetical protein
MIPTSTRPSSRTLDSLDSSRNPADGWSLLFERIPTDDIIETVAAAEWWRDAVAANRDAHHPELPAVLADVIADAEAELARRHDRWSAGSGIALDLDTIKTRVDIAGYLTHTFGCDFQPRGHGEFVARCVFPDHDDREPSLFVNAAKGTWFCFGCRRGGDIISLKMLTDDLTFRQAVDVLRWEAGLPARSTPATRPASDVRRREVRHVLRVREVSHHG